MSKEKNNSNPVTLDAGMPDELFAKYIAIRDKQFKLVSTLPELTTEVKRVFYGSHKDVPKTNLDKIWAFMYPMMSRNQALTQFILDYGGAESDYFFPWVMSVATSPSEALELSYNAGRDLSGNWTDDIPETDKINYFVRNLPTLAFNRERQAKVAELATLNRNEFRNTGSKVIDLGAGRMAWARHSNYTGKNAWARNLKYTGFTFRPTIQKIIACDRDPNIQPDELFAPWNLEEKGITYKRSDIMMELQDADCAEASLIVLRGVASYYPMGVFREAIVKPIYHNLRKGGSFFFDLQLNHISYEWSVKVFGWPEMELPEKASDAIDVVQTLRTSLWKEGMKFEATYMLDNYNASPLSVMILFKKI